jgi:hypothetical protein
MHISTPTIFPHLSHKTCLASILDKMIILCYAGNYLMDYLSEQTTPWNR